MQKATMAKRLLLFVCVWVMIASGCQAQAQKSADWLPHAFSQTAWRIPEAHSERPYMLDEDQWYMDDDAIFGVSSYDQRTMFVTRNALRLLWSDILLAGLAILFACVAERIYHSSSAPTHGLLRILAFILNADGQKDNISSCAIA